MLTETIYNNNSNYLNKKNNKNLSSCNVENFVINNFSNCEKIKKLEEENNRLKNELSIFKNKSIELDEINTKENVDNKNYFLNKGRKILLSKFSKIKFIKKLSNQIKNIKNINRTDNEDAQILIQLNQTIKNLNQNIINGNDRIKNDKTFLQKKLSGKIE